LREVLEAYQTLGDSGKRANYDQQGYEEAEKVTDNPQFDPVVCSHCKKTTAQPRYIVFRYVFSVILGTVSTPIQGIFCSRCATLVGLRSSAISAAFGWWGFPWGPIYTIRDILTNAFGGMRPPGSEQRLLWYNALAFLSRGNLAIARGLARRVQVMDNNELSSRATDLISHLQRGLAAGAVPELKNPWSNVALKSVPHLLMLCAAPAAVVALIASQPSAFTGHSADVATAGSGLPPAISAAQPSPVLTPSAPTTAAAPIEESCSSAPHSGEILTGETPSASPGHKLQIKNGSDGSVIVRVRDATSGQTRFSFYVERGEEANVSGIPDGTYRIQYAIGQRLRSDCRSLTGIVAMAEFPQESLQTLETAEGTQTSSISYTLYTVPNGNVSPTQISAGDFNAP
jgi:hypothetical protein